MLSPSGRIRRPMGHISHFTRESNLKGKVLSVWLFQRVFATGNLPLSAWIPNHDIFLSRAPRSESFSRFGKRFTFPFLKHLLQLGFSVVWLFSEVQGFSRVLDWTDRLFLKKKLGGGNWMNVSGERMWAVEEPVSLRKRGIEKLLTLRGFRVSRVWFFFFLKKVRIHKKTAKKKSGKE